MRLWPRDSRPFRQPPKCASSAVVFRSEGTPPIDSGIRRQREAIQRSFLMRLLPVHNQIGKTAQCLRIAAQRRLVDVILLPACDFLGGDSCANCTELLLRIEKASAKNGFGRLKINHGV